MTPKDAPTTGARIRALRALCSLTREEFSATSGINVGRLRSMEMDITDLAKKHVHVIIETFRKEGILCHERWLMHGEGPFPLHVSVLSRMSGNDNFLSFDSHRSTIDQEAQAFLSAQGGRLVINVEETSHEPFFRKDDVVGGVIVYNKKEFPNYTHHPCIVNHPSIENKLVIRRMVHQKDERLFLLPMNGSVLDAEIVLESDISFCAPIIWHRKRS